MEQTTHLAEVAAAHPSTSTPSAGLMDALWRDERGFIISAELVMIATILVLGLIAGLTCVRDAVTGELTDVADAIDSLNQSYSYTGMHGCWSQRCGRQSFTAGSAFFDCEEGVEGDVYFFDAPCQARIETPACPIEEPCPIVEPQVMEEPTPCPCPEPCPPPCPPQPCPQPCPPTTVPCEPTPSGTVYYEYGPVHTVPQVVVPCDPCSSWQAGGNRYPQPVW